MILTELIPSFVAILLLSLLAYYLFPKKDILTPVSASNEFNRYAPQHAAEKAIISTDKKIALIKVQKTADTLGLITSLGDKLVCRTIELDTGLTITQSHNKFTLSYQDITFPSVTFLAAEEDVKTVQELLTSFKITSNGTGNSHAT